MGLFDKKDKKKLTPEEIAHKERQEMVKRIMDERLKEQQNYDFNTPEFSEFQTQNTGNRNISVGSREYNLYKEEERQAKEPKTFYEKFAYHSGKLLNVSPDPDSTSKLQNAIDFSGMHATPTGITSGSIIIGLLSFILILLSFFLPLGGIMLKIIMVLFVPLVLAYFFFTYPFSYTNTVRIKEGRELITALLYIVVYLRSVPNLENAVRFASENLTGKTRADLKRVFWKVEVGIHNSVEESLMEYLKQWKNYNKEFLEAMHLIRESMIEADEKRREAMLDNAINVVLEGMDDKMKNYARNLEMPVTVVHGMGILLPVMGMIVFPLLSVFLASDISNIPMYLFFGYDIVLPLTVYIFIRHILETRPATHSSVEIAPQAINSIKGVSFKNMLNMERIILGVAIISAFIFIIPGVNFLFSTGMFEKCVEGSSLARCGMDGVLKHTFSTMMMSMLIVFGLGIFFIIYNFGRCYKSLEIRSRVQTIEAEFEEAMFALGNRLASGIPIEFALEKAIDDTKELSISNLFEISLKNMNSLSMSFYDSLFDRNYGALKDYPSPLIRTIMRSVSGTLERGSKYAAVTMLVIATYLKSMRSTQEKINDLLSSIVSSMKFQAYILVPAISGVVIGVSDLIIKMLSGLAVTFAGLKANMPGNMGGLNPGDIINIGDSMPAELLQIVVGVYVVEILVILAYFVTRIEEGVDDIKLADNTWKFVLIGMMSYVLILVIIMAIFSPLADIASTL